MNDNRNLKWGIVLSYVNTAATFVVALLYTPFLLQSLGQQQYGLYNMGQAAVSYLGLAEFGFGNAVVRYSAKYRAEGNRDKEESLYGVFFYIYWVMALAVLLVGTAIGIFADRFYTVSTGAEGYRQLRTVIFIMVINLTFTMATTPFSAIITAYERYTFAKVLNLVYTLLKPLTMIPLLLWGYKAVTLSVVTFILTALMHVANIIYVRRRLHVRVNLDRSKLDFSIVKEVVGYSFFIFLGSVVGQLNDNTDNLILGVISGEAAVAVYTIAYTLNGYMQMIPTTVSGVFFPRVTMRVTEGASMKDMSSLMNRVGRISFLISFLVVSGFVLFGQEFIRLWAGEGYAVSYWIVLVLVIPHVIPNIQVIPVHVIQAMNKHQFKAVTYVMCAVLNVALSIPAGLKWGPLGCAACTGVVTVLTKGIIINWYYEKKIHLNIRGFWRVIAGLMLRLLPAVPVGLLLNRVIPESGWLTLIAKIAVYTGCYCLLAYWLAMNREEKELANGVLRRVGLVR